MTGVLRVVEPGLLTTVQDVGRPQAIASGVPPGGAMDRFAHSAANLLVGNDRTAATLECTVIGPTLVAEADCLVAVTGGEFEVPMWTAVSLGRGDELRVGRSKSGARAYVAVAGGLIADRWLGSQSTNLMAGRGGMQGRALRAGDVLSAGETSPYLRIGRNLPEGGRPRYRDHVLHVIPGPQASLLTSAFFGVRFTVGLDSNRMGYRLDGPRLETGGKEVLSFGLVAGAVQLPSGGRPILLMADHQTAGGYPVIATVVSASMPVAAQLAPGDELTFVETTIADALDMRRAQRLALDSLTNA
ncbi:MAG TPA: biotin-dependent carboxyltransferase family protein [Candidatus Dormibacteraeota bacterium]|nr:biotin-dependent carboxyltransferase family protein [Candidatus Dormibacteraeota bacterium]